MKNPPTLHRDGADHEATPVIVHQKVNILNIDRIDTVNMMFALTMEVSFEWKDHRFVDSGNHFQLLDPARSLFHSQAQVQESA